MNELATQIHVLAKEKGWWDTPRELPEVLMLCVSELSECLEEYRDGAAMCEVKTAENGKPTGIPIELADVIIRILDFCAMAGIDIDEAVRIKHSFNKSRPFRHGGKVC
jgi:NTP pyrophosphatase (non-canonical NTP hydrolase)